MRKIVIIILALVVALGAIPVTFACYNGGWGNWNWFWNPDNTVHCCPTYCNLIFTEAEGSDNEDTFAEPKEVGDTQASVTCCGKAVKVTIDNAYPGYEGTIDFCVRNTGTTPATLDSISTDYPDPAYLQIELTGEIQEGTVIQPCETKCGQLKVFGVPQLEDAQNQCYTFEITLDYNCSCVPQDCETAYAYNRCYSTCFSEWGFSQWGWTNGPLAPKCQTYYFSLYAGAAQCKLYKGDKVGWVTVKYYGSSAIVKYYLYPGYKLDETHLYIGNQPLPGSGGGFTVAPGQYTYSHDLNNATTDCYRVTGLSGKIYIIAHAAVCD